MTERSEKKRLSGLEEEQFNDIRPQREVCFPQERRPQLFVPQAIKISRVGSTESEPGSRHGLPHDVSLDNHRSKTW